MVILAGPSRAAPQVVSVNISDNLITESDDGGTLTITITYNEDMDTSVDPDIAFDPDIVASGTLTFNSGAWTSSRTYEANYTIADVDEEVSGVDVIVENAINLGGEKQDPYTEPDAIDVDMYIGIPTLIYPINGENTNDNTPILQWQSLIDGSPPVWYYVSVSDNATFPYENASSGWITDNNWTTPNLSDGVWYWRVRARDNAGNEGGWSSVWSFRVDTIPPAAPSLVSPPDGENTNDNTPTLVWNNVFENSLPVVYTIEVDNENTFTAPLVFTTTLTVWSTTGTSSVTTSVLPDGVYYWRVKARDNAGNDGPWSSVWSFRVDTIPPAAPINLQISPDNWTKINSFTLTWTNPPDPSGVVMAYYKFDSPPTSPSDYNGSAPATGIISNLSVPGEGVRTIYLWLEDGVGNANPAAHSTVQAKLDLYPPQKPEISSNITADTPTSRNSPSFSWTSVGGPSPVMYYYRLDGYDESWKATTETSTSYSDLPDGEYIFRVRAVDTGGESETAIYRIIIDTTPSTLELTITGIALTETATGWFGESSTNTITLSGRLEPGSRMTINGNPVSVSAGSFNTTLMLSPGTNVFRIRIVDPAGNVTERILTIVYSAPPVSLPPRELVMPLVVLAAIIIIITIVVFLRRFF
ncbi:MAG: Ig-like domain-containing protein [Candidatus Hadarchaeales archaeon]